MAIAIVGTSLLAHGASVSSVTTAGKNTTNGNTIILATAIFTASFVYSSVSDSNTNTWTQNAVKLGTSTTEARQFSNSNISGGVGQTFTLTLNGAGFPTLIAAEFSGLATSGAFDQTANGAETGSASHSTGTTATLANASELVYANGACYNTGGSVANSDGTFTQDQVNQNITDENAVSAYKIVAATTAVSWNGYTTGAGGNAAQVLCTYKAASAGGQLIGTPMIGERYSMVGAHGMVN